MSKYKLLIIDDEWNRRKKAYQKVLEDKSLFELIFLHHPGELTDIDKINPDGYILDIFLSENGWQTKASEVIEKYISKNIKPIFLITEHLTKDEIKDEINSLLRHPIPINLFFSWQEFANSENKITRNENSAATRWKIQVELDEWHQRSKFQPSPDQTLRILHISDLQFHDPGTSTKSFLVEDAIAHSLKNDNKSPDFLFISGDIAYSGKPDEYKSALNWFDHELLPQIFNDNIDNWRERIIIVPGNHDVNLRLSSCDSFDYNFSPESDGDIFSKNTMRYKDHKKYGLDPFKEFAVKLSPDKNWHEKETLCWVSNRFLGLGIQFILFNSVMSIDFQEPSKSTIDEKKLLRPLKREIHAIDSDVKPFRIVISHHGPQSRDTSINAITNWSQVENFIESTEIDLFVHGHGHGYEASPLGGSTSRKDIPIVMAPTTHLNGKLRNEDQLRGFNLIELYRKENQIIGTKIHHYEVRGAKAKIENSSNLFKRI